MEEKRTIELKIPQGTKALSITAVKDIEDSYIVNNLLIGSVDLEKNNIFEIK